MNKLFVEKNFRTMTAEGEAAAAAAVAAALCRLP